MDLNQDARYIFWISLLLILFVYFAGAMRVIPALSNAIVDLIQASQGRNKAGNYPAYPAGA